VEHLIEAYQWRLMAVAELVAALLARAASEQESDSGQAFTPEQIRKWAIHHYCLAALHPACLGSRGSQAQQQAFQELADYLYRLAQRTWPGVAEDATQDALVAIYEKAHLCRNSGAFLAFAIQKLRDAARRRLRAGSREFSLDELLEADVYGEMSTVGGGAGDADTKGGMVSDATSDAILARELRIQVVERLQQLRTAHPRARRQLDTVWLRYVQELSLEEISAQLETPVENVSVLLSRGLERLREDSGLLALASEFVQQSNSL
jgi:RNA polymerase sigma factor (sigma-70 family)